jgi:hypothetical protein
MGKIKNPLEFPIESYGYFSGQSSAKTAVVWYFIFNMNFLNISVVLVYK